MRFYTEIKVTQTKGPSIDTIYESSNVDFKKVFEVFKKRVQEQLKANAKTSPQSRYILERFGKRRGAYLLPLITNDYVPGSYVAALSYLVTKGEASGLNFAIQIGGVAPSGRNVSDYAALIDKAFSNGTYTVKRTHSFIGSQGFTTLKAGRRIKIHQPIDTRIAFEDALAELRRQLAIEGPQMVKHFLFTKSASGKTYYSYRDALGRFKPYRNS